MFIIDKAHIHRVCSLLNDIHDFLFAENSFCFKSLNLYTCKLLYKIFFSHISNPIIFEKLVLSIARNSKYHAQLKYFRPFIV